ncbi:L,D-transpeptidase family protein [Luteipulveratus halotolerans]|uniref:L,D-TPase catalytic domain-containing protein n=1 Tax=Luteipulveratus halotolerans TaxID=1631356 RepID=A0A0L6CGV7_9MICO|nr:L,D-transpeptidase family protein [Luteipulveratus halotolerans]KNX37037.1 hypothetical protein VV01_07570 [Luteipulveratus halotolerans]
MRNLSSRARLTAALALPLSVGLLAACGSQPVDQAASSTTTASATTRSASVTPGPATPSTSPSTSPSSAAAPSETPSLEEAEGATPLVAPTTSTSSTSSATPQDSTSSTSSPSTTSPSASPTTQPDADDHDTSADGSSAVLKTGSSGPDVRAVQQRLTDLGYWGGAPDGSFGGGTRQSVLALQKAAGISRTGKVDAATRRALDRGVVPRSRTGASKAIEIDLDRQILLAVEGGRVKAVINASSGNGETFVVKNKETGKETKYRAHTPRGSYSVYAEDDKLHESTLELGSMWRPKYFDGAIAVHGSGSVPAYPASHGCVRVSNSAMNWLWDSWGLPIGTPVKVY